MPPITEFLQIAPKLCLQLRIYLDNPFDLDTWFRNPRDPILPKVITAIGPLIWPKLNEEKQRAKSSGVARKRAVKDVVQGDEFEVSLFLTDHQSSTKYYVLDREKTLQEPDLVQRGKQLPEELDAASPVIRQEDDEDPIDLTQIPEAPQPPTKKRKRQPGSVSEHSRSKDTPQLVPVPDSEDEGDSSGAEVIDVDTYEMEAGRDDKKELRFNVSYNSLDVYSKILCLIVRRKPQRPGNLDEFVTRQDAGSASRSATEGADENPVVQRSDILEGHITSTQAVRDYDADAINAS